MVTMSTPPDHLEAVRDELEEILRCARTLEVWERQLTSEEIHTLIVEVCQHAHACVDHFDRVTSG